MLSLIVQSQVRKKIDQQRYIARWIKWFFAAILCVGQMPTSDAQTVALTTVHLFAGQPADGAAPSAGLIEGAGGLLYGITSGGGQYNSGVLFQFDPKGLISVLDDFTGGVGGGYPTGKLIQLPSGALLGTTIYGGDLSCDDRRGCGTVFGYGPDPYELALHLFAGSDGADPYVGLVASAAGDIYGSTQLGGAANAGTVFKTTTDGQITTLAQLDGVTAKLPGVIAVASDGSLRFAATQPQSGQAMIMSISPAGQLAVQQVLSFEQGVSISALVTMADGSVYGTATQGGDSVCNFGLGCGTVFHWSATEGIVVLHTFHGDSSGGLPANLIIGNDGNLYGTTASGGDWYCDFGYGCGTVFQLTPSGVLSTLHRMTGPEGAAPSALIQTASGKFYGMAAMGGGGYGTIFNFTLPTGPAAPQQISVTMSDVHEAIISWTPVSGASQYQVFQAVDADAEYGALLRTTPRTSLKVTRLKSGHLYCYAVAATNSSGPGLSSGEACVSVS